MGGAKTREAIEALEQSRFAKVAAIALSYYDKAYLFSTSRRVSENVHDIQISGVDMDKDASAIIEFAHNCL